MPQNCFLTLRLSTSAPDVLCFPFVMNFVAAMAAPRFPLELAAQGRKAGSDVLEHMGTTDNHMDPAIKNIFALGTSHVKN